MSANRWIVLGEVRPAAALRLFCIPYAGGGFHVYRTWARHLPEWIEPCCVDLPGRGARWKEKPYTSYVPLVEALVEGMGPFLTKPFALFGHSLGALIAFEVARTLRRRGQVAPRAVLVSGRGAPQLPDTRPPIHRLPDHAFAEKIRNYHSAARDSAGADPEAPLTSELLELFLPVLRSDFTICETYRYVSEPPLDCHIAAFWGTADPAVAPSDAEAWSEMTVGSLANRSFPGGHFFIRSCEREVLAAIEDELRPWREGR